MWNWLAELFMPDFAGLLPTWLQWLLVGVVLAGLAYLWFAFR